MESSSTLAVLCGSPARPVMLVGRWEGKTLGKEGEHTDMKSRHSDKTCLGIPS